MSVSVIDLLTGLTNVPSSNNNKDNKPSDDGKGADEKSAVATKQTDNFKTSSSYGDDFKKSIGLI